MGKHWMQEWVGFYGAVPIPSKCPLTGTRTCQRKDCRHYRYSDLSRDLDERCAHSARWPAVDRHREIDFHPPPRTATGTAPSSWRLRTGRTTS